MPIYYPIKSSSRLFLFDFNSVHMFVIIVSFFIMLRIKQNFRITVTGGRRCITTGIPLGGLLFGCLSVFRVIRVERVAVVRDDAPSAARWRPRTTPAANASN